MSNENSQSVQNNTPAFANTENKDQVVKVESVSPRAAESADERPTPHDTPHEVAGSPVRSPADLEGDGSPGTSDPATKQLPP